MMTYENDRVASAQVLLRAAGGREVTGEDAITSENIAEYTPSPSTFSEVTQILTELGFDVGAMVGASLSITAPARTFRDVFQIELCQGEDGGIRFERTDGCTGLEVPPGCWPPRLADVATSVTFVPPPEFGPPEFFGA